MTDRTRRLFPPEEDAKILAMIAAGIPLREIAAAIGRLASSVGSRVRKLQGKPAAPSGLVMRKPQPSATASLGGQVRCLGGCGKIFDSPDRLRIRRCPTCKARRACSGLPDDYALRL